MAMPWRKALGMGEDPGPMPLDWSDRVKEKKWRYGHVKVTKRKTAYSIDLPHGVPCNVYLFDVVSFNGDLLFSACALQNTPAVRIVERPEMLKFPIASGQRYVLLHGTTIIPMRRDLGNYLIPESRNRITVVSD